MNVRQLVDHFMCCEEVDGVCNRHGEAWTKVGCPFAFRAAYRLEPGYSGTLEQEAKMNALLKEAQ